MKPPFNISNKIVNLVSQIAEELGKIEASKLITPGPQLRKRNRIKTIQATLAIEGNTLSIEQITAVIEGGKVLGPKKEIIEVQNAIGLYEEVLSFRPYSVKDFLKAHRKLMSSLISSCGKFRNSNVGVLKGNKVSHIAPKPRIVPELVEKLFKWARSEKDLHPLIKSCILHYEIEFIHSFEDGNGRMGRFWQTVVLAEFNSIFTYLPIESLIKENQKKYYSVLEECDRAGDCSVFIEFMLEIILISLKDFSEGITNVVLSVAQRLEKGKSYFGDNLFSRKDYMSFFKNISSATASRDLKEGASKKVLKKIGEGNQSLYKFK